MRLVPFEKHWLALIMETMLPSGRHPRVPLGAKDVPMGTYLEDLFRCAPLKFLLAIRFSIWAIIWLPLLWGKPVFWHQDEAEKIAWLKGLRQSRWFLLREIPFMVKTVVFLGYGGFPAIQRQVGIEAVGSSVPAWAALDRQDLP